MKEVAKEDFRRVYFKLGGGDRAGWGAAYWEMFFEREPKPGMKYLVQEPESPKHTRMMIVTDNHAHQYRLFFLTENDEERLFDCPGEE